MKLFRYFTGAAMGAFALASAPVLAATIDFETTDSGSATVIGAAVAAGDYDALGVTFTDAFYFRCGGGCPMPANGTFVSSGDFRGPFTINFANAISAFSFANVSASRGTASAFDAGNNLLGSVTFNGFPATFALNFAGARSITFSTDSQFGVDDFDFAVDGAVPEPSTWAMLILGFGVLGTALRRTKRSPRLTFA